MADDDHKVPHQEDVEDVVEDVLAGGDDGGTANAFIAAAVTNHTVNASFSNTEVKGHLDALGTKLNQLRTAMINSGQIPPS